MTIKIVRENFQAEGMYFLHEILIIYYLTLIWQFRNFLTVYFHYQTKIRGNKFQIFIKISDSP